MNPSRSILLAILLAASASAATLTADERAIAETYIARRAEFVEQRFEAQMIRLRVICSLERFVRLLVDVLARRGYVYCQKGWMRQ